MSIHPDLTDAEVDAICDGLVQNAAKVRYLEGLGLIVKRKPNGRPLVNRAHYDAVRSGRMLETAGGSDEEDGMQWSTKP